MQGSTGAAAKAEVGAGTGDAARCAWSALSAAAIAAVGSLAALAWTRIARASARDAPGPPRYFVADRDAGEVVALDADLLVVRKYAFALPVEIETRRDGGLWVAGATHGGPLGPHCLRRLEAGGRVAVEIRIGPVLDLDTLDGGPALVVSALPDGAREALLVHSAGASLALSNDADLACIAGAGTRVAVGTGRGVLRIHDASGGAVLQRRELGGALGDVAAGPESGTWWVLDARGGPDERRILLLGPDLSTRWERRVGLLAHRLGPVPAEERVWVVDSAAPLARRFGPGGALEVPLARLELSGCERVLARSSAGAVFAAPGALLVIDAAGRPLPGQGGFDFLVDVAESRGP